MFKKNITSGAKPCFLSDGCSSAEAQCSITTPQFLLKARVVCSDDKDTKLTLTWFCLVLVIIFFTHFSSQGACVSSSHCESSWGDTSDRSITGRHRDNWDKHLHCHSEWHFTVFMFLVCVRKLEDLENREVQDRTGQLRALLLSGNLRDGWWWWVHFTTEYRISSYPLVWLSSSAGPLGMEL